MAETKVFTSPHAEAAKALLEKIRALRAEFPRFVLEDPDQSKKLAPNTALPDDFVESASVGVDALPRLEAAAGANGTAMRDAFAFALAYDPAVAELEAFTRAAAHTVRVQRATAGAAALDVYAIARRLAKRKDGLELLPYVQNMRDKLGRSGKTRKTTSETAPAPPATTDDEKKPVS